MLIFFTKILGGISKSYVDGYVTVPHAYQASWCMLSKSYGFVYLIHPLSDCLALYFP